MPISKLRQKIEKVGPQVIQTVWGVGYKFDDSKAGIKYETETPISTNVGIFAVILTLIVFGIAFSQFSSRMIYQDTWKQLEGYADSVFQQSVVVSTSGS